MTCRPAAPIAELSVELNIPVRALNSAATFNATARRGLAAVVQVLHDDVLRACRFELGGLRSEVDRRLTELRLKLSLRDLPGKVLHAEH